MTQRNMKGGKRSGRLHGLLTMLATAALLLAAGAATAGGIPLDRLPGNAAERRIVALGAADALEAMANGRLSSETYVMTLLDRMERYAEVNAILHVNAELALDQARAADEARAEGVDLGPLHGLPVLIKDSINTADYPTTAGTPALAGFEPGANAPVVQALVDAGAIVLGKTNLTELSAGYTSTNFFTGPVLNPYEFDVIPGGSSGGNGAALAARFAPLAIGGDTTGSVRVPAALTGTVGFRPTTNPTTQPIPGRYDGSGGVPLSPTLDTFGPMARSVEDLALADAVLAGDSADLERVSLEGLRVGVPFTFFYELLDPRVEKALERAFTRLEKAGVELVEADLPFAGFPGPTGGILTVESALAITVYEAPGAIDAYLSAWGAGITVDDVFNQVASPDVQALVAAAQAGIISETDYLQARGFVEGALLPAFLDYFTANDLDAVITPSNILPAPPIGVFVLDELGIAGFEGLTVFDAYFRTAHYMPLVGAPTVTLPIGQLPGGQPVGGIDVSGPPGDDRRLLALAAAMERVLPRIRPPRDIRPLPGIRPPRGICPPWKIRPPRAICPLPKTWPPRGTRQLTADK